MPDPHRATPQHPRTHVPARQGWRQRAWRLRTWIVAVVAAALASVLTAQLQSAVNSGITLLKPPGLPFTYNVRLDPFDRVECRDRVVATPPDRLPAPPVDPPVADVWWASHEAVDAGTTTVEVLLQGNPGETVVLQALTVHVIRRAHPLRGYVYRPTGCGAALQARPFKVNLNRPAPVAEPQPGSQFNPVTGRMQPLPPVGFPFVISNTDPEDFVITATAIRSDCTWDLQLTWSSNGTSHTSVITNAGQPFQTTAEHGLPVYVQASNPGRAWSPAPAGTRGTGS